MERETRLVLIIMSHHGHVLFIAQSLLTEEALGVVFVYDRCLFIAINLPFKLKTIIINYPNSYFPLDFEGWTRRFKHVINCL